MIWTDLFYRILKAIKTMELTLTYLKINSRFRMFTTFTFLLIYAFPITVDENIIGAPTKRNKFCQIIHFSDTATAILDISLLHPNFRESNLEKKQRNDTKKKAKKIERDNFTEGIREKSNNIIIISHFWSTNNIFTD